MESDRLSFAVVLFTSAMIRERYHKQNRICIFFSARPVLCWERPGDRLLARPLGYEKNRGSDSHARDPATVAERKTSRGEKPFQRAGEGGSPVWASLNGNPSEPRPERRGK